MTIPKIISTFSTYEPKDKRMGPVFQMSSNGIFPVNETLLPLFKRRIAGLISQTKKWIKEKKFNEFKKIFWFF